MKITFDLDGRIGPSGTCAFAPWHDPDLQKAIRQCFNVFPTEQISEVVIKREGIRVILETVALRKAAKAKEGK